MYNTIEVIDVEYTRFHGETNAHKMPHEQKNRCFPFVVLVYVVKGTYFCTIDGNLITISEGQMLVVPPFTYHDVCMKESGVLHWAHISVISQQGDVLSQFCVPNVVAGEQALRLRDAVIRANKSVNTEGLCGTFLRDSAVADAYRELITLATPTRSHDKYDLLIDSVREQVAGQLGNPYTLKKLASMANMSESTFSARFRKLYGTSPMRYFLDLRIKQATYLLLRGMSVSQTASQLGFYDTYHFSHCFKRHIGCNPTEYVATHTIEV